jgi:hypothetical protein
MSYLVPEFDKGTFLEFFPRSLSAGAMVDDPIILESIGPDFISSLARPPLFSPSTGLNTGASLRVELVKSSDYRDLSILSVPVLRFRHPLLLHPRGKVNTLDATAYLVSILSAGTAALEYLRAEVLAIPKQVRRILLGFVAEH